MQRDQADGDPEELTEASEPEGPGKITLSELWPPSPRVRILFIGLGFALFNGLLLCVWAVVLYMNR
jgi:hypothetical protein